MDPNLPVSVGLLAVGTSPAKALIRGRTTGASSRNIKLRSWESGIYVSTTEVSVPETMMIAVTEDTLTTEPSDGRAISRCRWPGIPASCTLHRRREAPLFPTVAGGKTGEARPDAVRAHHLREGAPTGD